MVQPPAVAAEATARSRNTTNQHLWHTRVGVIFAIDKERSLFNSEIYIYVCHGCWFVAVLGFGLDSVASAGG